MKNLYRILCLGLVVACAAAFSSSAGSETVKYTYDSAGRIVKALYENGKQIEYQYDNSGALVKRTVGEGQDSVPLYYPHVATVGDWETEIAVINSTDAAISGVLRMHDNSGRELESRAYTLAARQRVEITVGAQLTNPDSIGYMVFEADKAGCVGYTKFFLEGRSRVAVPAVSAVNQSDIYISHIASGNGWNTGVSLVNTTDSAVALTIELSDGSTFEKNLAAGAREVFAIRDLFGGREQTDIGSGVIKNAAGVVGLELFSQGNLLSGIILKDVVTATMYYPHVAMEDQWNTGIVAYNPADGVCDIQITPYSAEGTPLAPQNRTIAPKSRYVGTATALNFPAETAWLSIQASSDITGFELFTRLQQMAGYTGVNIAKTAGIFPKIERQGATGIAVVNISQDTANVSLTAYDDNGTLVERESLNLNPGEKLVKTAARFFTGDISNATYIAFTSDRQLVGFQLNSSSDSMMLDALPAM